MNLLQRIALKVLRGTAHEDWMAYYGPRNGRRTKAGPPISETSAMTISALYAALNFIAGVVASLPLRVYRNLRDGGKERALDHPLYDRLHTKANSTGLTAWQWVYTSILHKYLWGNWWTHAPRDLELTPLLPDRTWIDPRTPMFVRTRDNTGSEVILDRRDVLLIPHVSLGGVTGRGVIHYARESLGLIKAQDEFASSFFGSGVKAGGFVQVPHGVTMDEKTREGLQKDFNEKYANLGESWKAIFLSGGAEWKPNEIDAQKAQALESRQFSIAEVSRWTGLSPHLLHDLSRATFNNIEELDLALVTFTLTPIVTQIEQAMNVTFFDDAQRQEFYVKFELKGLLRGNLQARTQFYREMLDRGVFTADDVLELEDMNPQPDGLGQVYLVPLNMVNKRAVAGPAPVLLEPGRMRNVTPGRLGISAPGRVVLQRSSALRRKLTIAYGKQWEAYTTRVVEEETRQLREGIKEWITERSAVEFVAWLEKFYDGFRERIGKLSAPLLTSYAGAILPVALEEVASEADVSPQYDAFVAEYREGFVRRHIGRSRSELTAAVADVEDAGASAEELLQRWEESRPGIIQMHESIRAESAFARSAFALAGITKIRAVTYNHNCPYCEALDGRVIGMDEAFLSEGEFWPEGAERPLIVTSTHRHPPFHQGCDCGIEAST